MTGLVFGGVKSFEKTGQGFGCYTFASIIDLNNQPVLVLVKGHFYQSGLIAYGTLAAVSFNGVDNQVRNDMLKLYGITILRGSQVFSRYSVARRPSWPMG